MLTATTQTPSQTHRKASPVDFDLLAEVLPPKMIAARRWLVWKYVENGGPKPNKVPHYAHNGSPRGDFLTPRDLNSLATFKQIREAMADPKWDGIGFVLGKDGDGFWQGIDLDHMDEKPWLEYAADSMVGYTERSPSGNGLHAIGYGQELKTIASNPSGIEVYSNGQYFTVTGDKAGGELCDLAGFVRDILTPIREKHDPTFTQEATRGRKRTQEYSRILKQGRGRPAAKGENHILPIPKEALGKLLPTSEGQRNKKVFDLARYAVGKYSGATPEELKPLVRQWHEAALPVIGTKGFLETWVDFCNGLKKVTHPMGATMNEIVEQVEVPTEVPPEHEDLGLNGYHLLRICTALQEFAGNDPFFLGCRTAGELIGRSHTDASKLLRAMVGEGYLREVSKGNQSGRTASTYLLLRSA